MLKALGVYTKGFFAQIPGNPSSHTGAKSPRVQELLATGENPLRDSRPEAGRGAAAAVEPKLRVAAPHIEHARAAKRANYRLHADQKPLAVGLILILQTQLRTNLGRTQI